MVYVEKIPGAMPQMTKPHDFVFDEVVVVVFRTFYYRLLLIRRGESVICIVKSIQTKAKELPSP